LLKWVDYDERKETRERVWRLLGEYGHPGTRAAAFSHLDDDAPFVRIDAFRILRKLRDKRIIPRAQALLQTTTAKMMGENPPLEGLITESFRAGAIFELRDGINLAIFICARSMVEGEGYIPSQVTVRAAVDYVVALDARQATKVLERMYHRATDEEVLERMYHWVTDEEHNIAEAHRGLATAVASALEKFTGEAHPLPSPPTRRKTVGVYFIDIRSEKK